MDRGTGRKGRGPGENPVAMLQAFCEEGSDFMVECRGGKYGCGGACMSVPPYALPPFCRSSYTTLSSPPTPLKRQTGEDIRPTSTTRTGRHCTPSKTKPRNPLTCPSLTLVDSSLQVQEKGRAHKSYLGGGCHPSLSSPLVQFQG